MSLKPLLEVIHEKQHDNWFQKNKHALEALFGSPEGRYPSIAQKAVTLRAPEISSDTGVPFAAYIHPNNPSSGPYSGLSFVLFPIEGEPCLIGLGVGTQGLSPDEVILGRPGHARKARAIVTWLNSNFGAGNQIAWAKHDPTRTDIALPDDLSRRWSAYKTVFDRYGREMYLLFNASLAPNATQHALSAILDLFFQERGYEPISNRTSEAEAIRAGWFEHLLPSLSPQQVHELLERRKFVVIQGPPGTGKTRMATMLVGEQYGGNGRSVQFHPNTTYENVVGGLAPVSSPDSLGLRFSPKPGFLMEAAAAARKLNKPYLLHIDEINRADLAKILGEAIFLLEANSEKPRTVTLPYSFDELPTPHNEFSLPDNLHILGTMNSADRSIAIVDVAVRRRFAFVSLWPQMKVVQEMGCKFMQDQFRTLLSIFVEHAGDDSFNLLPGHSYFLEQDEHRAKLALKTQLGPLLEEYLAQGYVAGFAEPIRSYLQWVASL